MWFPSSFLFLCLVVFSSAESWDPQSVPRSGPISLPLHPIHPFAPRDVGNNTSTRSGLTPVTASSNRQQSYFTVIQLGQVSFRVALDTASSDVWVVSSNCTTGACTKVPRYPLAYQSPTFVEVNGNSTSFMAKYADGTAASGFVARETMHLSNLTVANQAFGGYLDCNVTMTDETSGIMGLGFPRLSSINLSVTNSTPFFVTLAQQGLLDYPLFGLSLTRNASGTLSMGAVDSSVVTNASLINWNNVAEFSPFGAESNVSSYLQWAIPMSSFGANGTQITPTPTYANFTHNTSLVVFDIGASGVYGPYQDVSRLYSLIEGARLVDTSGQWAIPCNTITPMTFTFGQQNYTLQPSDYIVGPASGNPNLCLSWPIAIGPSADGIDWQMGAAFLRTVYSVYSFGINGKEAPMIGLYPLRNATDVPEIPSAVSSTLSSLSATVATTLPNFPLSTPSYTTPAYAFNTSVPAQVGEVVSSGLATSTYSPIMQHSVFNLSALPTVSPSPTVFTLLLTDSSGVIHTSTSTHPAPSIMLGVPPGWSAGHVPRTSFFASAVPVVLFWTFLYMTDIFT
ncbi:acid protease [Tricholoma matsutake]|nr:acid protease [Tricholoma matsutake 945]